MSLQTLLASSARTASDVGSAITLRRNLKGLIFLLDLSAASSVAGDLLDVFVQDSIDNSNWCDRVAFTQCLGNGGVKKYEARLNCLASPATAMQAPIDGTLAAGSVLHGPISPYLRAKFVITDGGGSHSFTFGLTMQEIV